MVESQPSKLLVAGSIPVSRSIFSPYGKCADVAQLAEHVLGKDEVTSSILVIGSILRSPLERDGELRMASYEGLSTEARSAKVDGLIVKAT